MAQRTPELEDILNRFRRELERTGIKVDRILIFGSHARGEAQEGSDVDLIIVSEDWSRYSGRERLELLGIVAARIMESVQAQGFTPDEVAGHKLGTFWENIVQYQAVQI